ncbi:MAG: nuclear transport factor 2 family protein [Solirubrobacterales bacterium]
MTSLADKETIERLYAAFADRNGAAMTACYAKGAHFRDPAFGDLEGDDIGAMWRMLTGRARDLEITLREHEADEGTGTAHWIARYTFSTGRKVENDIQASFSFDEDGLITDTRPAPASSSARRASFADLCANICSYEVG